jgi:hypothetical protein
VGRRQGGVKLADHIENVTTQYMKMLLLNSRQ